MTTTEEQIEVEIGARLFDVTFERTSSVSRDAAYDADGRKAWEGFSVDEDSFELLRVVEILEDGEEIVDLSKDPALKKDIEGCVELWMDHNAPEYSEPDGPEHDD